MSDDNQSNEGVEKVNLDLFLEAEKQKDVISQLKNKVKKLETQLKQNKGGGASAEAKKEIAMQEKQIADLRSRNLELEKESIEMENKLKELESAASSQSVTQSSTSDDSSELTEEIEDLKSKLSLAKKEYIDERRKVILLTGKLDEIEEQTAQSPTSGASSTNDDQLHLLTTSNSSLKAENTSLKQKIAKLEEEGVEETDNSEMLNDLIMEKSSLQQQINEGQEKLQEEQDRNVQLLRQLTELQHKVSQLEAGSPSPKVSTADSSDLENQLQEANEVIEKQNRTIERIEDEMIDLDRKYDTQIIRLKKKVKSLQKDIKILEEKNEKLSSTKFKSVTPKTLTQRDQETEGDMALLDKMKELLKSWPGGIKLRNLAMSMGISISVTNDYLEVLERENFVTVDRENAENSNPVVHPV